MNSLIWICPGIFYTIASAAIIFSLYYFAVMRPVTKQMNEMKKKVEEDRNRKALSDITIDDLIN